MDMIYTEHEEATGFLAVAQAALERHESANGLMLGIGLRLVREPDAYGGRAYLATVESSRGLMVAAMMTSPYKLHKLQIHADDACEPAAVELVADGLLRGAWPVPGVLGREPEAQMFASIWCRRTGAKWRTEMRQTAYALRRVVHPCYPAGEFRAAGQEDIELVRRWARAFHQDCFGDGRPERTVATAEEKVKSNDLFLWVDRTPRSMAARGRPTPHGEAVSFVYTPPDERGKGYATAVVARASQRILDDGKDFCTLFANADNGTANCLYQRIGYEVLGNVVGLGFETPAERSGEEAPG